VCLAAPAVVLEVDYSEMVAVVDYGDGSPRRALIGISQDRVKKGDLVMVHAGVIVTKISEEDLLEQIEFFREALGEEAEHFVDAYKRLLEASKRLSGGE